MDTREVISLQAGPLTNRVCAHYWNFLTDFCAKPIEHNSVICPQTLLDGSSFKWYPRALAIDFADSIDYGLSCGNNAVTNGIFTAPCPLWHGTVDRIRRSTAITGGEDDKCSSSNGLSTQISQRFNHATQWSLCLSSHLRHYWMNGNSGYGPVCHIPDCLMKYAKTVERTQHDVDYLSSMPSYAQGREYFRTGSEIADDFEDRLRRIAERCDSPNAFQLLTDAETGFTGVACGMLDYLIDEFPKRTIFTIPIYQTAAFTRVEIDRKNRLMSMANQLALLTRLESPESMPDSAAWLPLDVSVFSPDISSCLATGMTAACLDCLTTPFQLADEHEGIRLEDVVHGTRTAMTGRVLSARFGFIASNSTYCRANLKWNVTSPYFATDYDLTNQTSSSCCQHATSFWRQLVLRGITEEEEAVSGLIRCVSPPTIPPAGCTIPKWWLPLRSGVNSIYSFTAASHLCIQRRTRAAFCDQTMRVCAASVLDSPSATSPDVIGLVRLVELFLTRNQQQRSHLSSQSPIDGMENDLWLDCLESARCRLLGNYSLPNARD